MTIDAAVRAKLAEVLRPLCGPRVYVDAAPAETDTDRIDTPYCVFQHSSDDIRANLDGAPSAHRRDTYAVAIWGRDGDGAKIEQARELARDAFRGANCQGYWGGPEGIGVWVCGAKTLNTSADIDPPTNGDEELDKVTTFNLDVVWER
jgi:hypothetical protein